MDIENDIEKIKKALGYELDKIINRNKAETATEIINLKGPICLLFASIIQKLKQLQEKNRHTNEKIDKLIYEMRQNGSQYWANRLEKLKEKEEEK